MLLDCGSHRTFDSNIIIHLIFVSMVFSVIDMSCLRIRTLVLFIFVPLFIFIGLALLYKQTMDTHTTSITWHSYKINIIKRKSCK